MAKKFEAEIKRVLICEDNQDIAALLRLLLEQFGLAADIACNAAQAKSMLAQGNYAAMTLELALPDQDGSAQDGIAQDGIGLIRELWAAQETAALPILVVSANAEARREELAGEASGVIDWINKPIDREQLAAALQQAVGEIFDTRLKVLHGFPPEDSCCDMAILDLSLPDGSDSVKDQLGREVARAKRQKMPLSLAMIDIDLFGQINDAYGHSAGNRVIQTLAHLLKQRLREADLVGRYGGEEFAIILSDADGEAAVKVMDNIRKDFSRLRHMAEGKEFFVTFSCGVADIARFGNAAKLGDAAEAALYKAKHAGRNRVVLAQEPPGAVDVIQ